MQALDRTKIHALASILMKGEATYRQGMTVKQITDVMAADPSDYPMSIAWVKKYIVSDEVVAHGINRSARAFKPFEYYFDAQRGARYEAAQEIISSASVSEDIANILVAMEERLMKAIETNQSSTGANAKMPKHVYYAYKFFSAADEETILKLMDLPKPSELGVTEEQWKACIGSVLRQGKAKIGGKRKSD